VSDLKVIETTGRQQLRAWLDADPGRNPSKLAGMLGLSQPAVRAWVIGASRPERPFREALQVLCGIPVEDWELAEERELRERALRLAATALAEEAERVEEKSTEAEDTKATQPAAE
jgi:transcriptional regulator with XRE-family HTH domain